MTVAARYSDKQIQTQGHRVSATYKFTVDQYLLSRVSVVNV